MKYSTNDLSRILGVSGNTIRRFDAMGYLDGERNEENGYRVFEYADLEKLMFVARYRKEELSHEEAALLLESGVDEIVEHLRAKQEEIKKQMERYQAINHLLKDDIMLMKRAKEQLGNFIEKECNPAHYILYIIDGKLTKDKKREKAMQSFMEACPEFYYFYMFDKEHIESGEFTWNEGVGANVIMTEKYGIDIEWPIEKYERRQCVVRFIRFPVTSDNEFVHENNDLWKKNIDEAMEYMKGRQLRLAGNVMVLKIGCFKEEGRLWKYLLIHYPVEKV